MEDKKNRQCDDEVYESNAARRLKALGGDEKTEPEEPLKVDKLANFWHYNKAKILIGGAFFIILAISLVQLISRQNPDISILYAGPDYITPNQCDSFCSLVESMMDDYNGDGRKYVLVEDLVFMSEDQIKDYIAAAQADNEDAAVDNMKNKDIEDRFSFEVFSGDAMLYILAEDQYNMVKDGGGFIRLDEIFDTMPDGAIDEYGIRFCETAFCRFFDEAKIFPADAVIALRGVPTASAITGKERAEKLHGYHEAVYRLIVGWEFPEGYVPEE